MYVDGFNVYHGAKTMLGRGVGWRWLDYKSLAHSLIQQHSGWAPPYVCRVVVCSAMISGKEDPGGP